MCAMDKEKHAIHPDLETMRKITFMPMILYQNMSFSLSGYLKDFSLRNLLAASHIYIILSLWKGQELVY